MAQIRVLSCVALHLMGGVIGFTMQRNGVDFPALYYLLGGLVSMVALLTVIK